MSAATRRSSAPTTCSTRTQHFYEWSLKLWEGLSHALDYNVMFSQRGVLNLANTPAPARPVRRSAATRMRLNGIDAELLTPDEIAKLCPGLDLSAKARFPVVGGLLQPRGGTARHDAVAWGFAHAADRLGVDIIENCEVTGFLKDGDRIVGRRDEPRRRSARRKSAWRSPA